MRLPEVRIETHGLTQVRSRIADAVDHFEGEADAKAAARAGRLRDRVPLGCVEPDVCAGGSPYSRENTLEQRRRLNAEETDASERAIARDASFRERYAMRVRRGVVRGHRAMKRWRQARREPPG